MNPAVLRLTLLATACGLLVSLAAVAGRDTIEHNRALYAARQLQDVIGQRDWKILPMTKQRYQLRDPSGQLKGFVFDTSTNQGYNGHIGLWLGVGIDGKVLGVRVKEHHETPGLGDKIERAISPWILSFNGHALDDGTRWGVKRDGGDFDEFTGATITPRAVVGAVKAGLAAYGQHRDAWIKEANHDL